MSLLMVYTCATLDRHAYGHYIKTKLKKINFLLCYLTVHLKKKNKKKEFHC